MLTAHHAKSCLSASLFLPSYMGEQVTASGVLLWGYIYFVLVVHDVRVRPGIIQPPTPRYLVLRRAFPANLGPGRASYRQSCLVSCCLRAHRVGGAFGGSLRSGQAETVGSTDEGRHCLSRSGLVICDDSRGRVVGGTTRGTPTVSLFSVRFLCRFRSGPLGCVESGFLRSAPPT